MCYVRSKRKRKESYEEIELSQKKLVKDIKTTQLKNFQLNVLNTFK